MWGLSWKPLSLKNNIDFRLGRHVEEDLVTTCRFGLSVWIGQILWSSALAVNLACFIPTTCLTVWIGWFGFSIIFGKIKRGKFQELTKETNYFTLYRRDLGVYGVSTIQCRLGNGYGCVAWRRWQTWTGLRRWQKKKMVLLMAHKFLPPHSLTQACVWTNLWCFLQGNSKQGTYWRDTRTKQTTKVFPFWMDGWCRYPSSGETWCQYTFVWLPWQQPLGTRTEVCRKCRVA